MGRGVKEKVVLAAYENATGRGVVGAPCPADVTPALSGASGLSGSRHPGRRGASPKGRNGRGLLRSKIIPHVEWKCWSFLVNSPFTSRRTRERLATHFCVDPYFETFRGGSYTPGLRSLIKKKKDQIYKGLQDVTLP